MKKTLLHTLAFLLVLGSGQSMAAEFKNGLGAGLQYGGIVGWQGSLNTDRSKFRAGLGYAGLTLGYDRKLGSKISLGGQAFMNQYVIGAGFNLNFHFSSHNSAGWMIGLDAYRAYTSAEAGLELILNYLEFIFDADDIGFDAGLSNGVLVSIGYQF